MSASPLRAALYLRVSTARQAEHDVSIPDQRKQGEAYCAARGYQLVETYVEPGASATNDRRPEFQRMMEAGTTRPPAFDVVIVHSFSRFFRDHFELEFYVRKLAKNGVLLDRPLARATTAGDRSIPRQFILPSRPSPSHRMRPADGGGFCRERPGSRRSGSGFPRRRGLRRANIGSRR